MTNRNVMGSRFLSVVFAAAFVVASGAAVGSQAGRLTDRPATPSTPEAESVVVCVAAAPSDAIGVTRFLVPTLSLRISAKPRV